jgi:hypothetical protein
MTYISSKPPERPAAAAVYFDTMDTNWLAAAAERLGVDEKIELFDWREGGGRWLTVHSTLLDPRKARAAALQSVLRAAGVPAGRFKR